MNAGGPEEYPEERPRSQPRPRPAVATAPCPQGITDDAVPGKRSYSRPGSSSGGISSRIDLAFPGAFSMKPLASSVTTIWCTDGGVTLKYLCWSASAGAIR